jgi:hypothetical protein
MRVIANFINELGRGLQRHGYFRAASQTYHAAARLAPSWAVPWFNLGLMAKFGHRWDESLRYTQHAAELDPNNKPAWWNLGIAATALGDWTVARYAWTQFGVTVPAGEGPPDMVLGAIPVRVDPNGTSEVVWCERLDPARARIVSIPFPESRRGWGDILLTDGEPRGYREHAGRQVPVFNELEVLITSNLGTFSVTLSAPDEAAIRALFSMAESQNVRIEDWSTVRLLCGACSEGLPHSSHASDPPTSEWKSKRIIGLAATNSDRVRRLLAEWSATDLLRTVSNVECVLQR